MNGYRPLLWLLLLLSAVLMSLPWLVPHCGAAALLGLVPLLLAEDLATEVRIKRFWPYSFAVFAAWNAATTFWVWNATAGGAIFAIVWNSLMMTLIFGLFRAGKRRLGGVVPYILLAAAWIAWERFYLSVSQFSWPWLVLGNAFAQTTRLVQWYEYTGALGGSLWVWAVNLGIFGLISALADGKFSSWNAKARFASIAGLVAVLAVPVAISLHLYKPAGSGEGDKVEVLIGQPNFDPYHKFEAMSQVEQTQFFLDLCERASDDSVQLFVAPETFTSDIVLDAVGQSPTVLRFADFLKGHKGADILFGASTYEFSTNRSQPHPLAYQSGGVWRMSRNSALVEHPDGNTEVCHKGKLVIGTELTPYPAVFTKVDDFIARLMKLRGPLMGRCIPQDHPSLLHLQDGTPFGCAVCYESVYGDYCASYARQGARFLAVITNDAWWGDTPGYRQHLSYSRLRAIETRRSIARCGNTGISCFINPYGDIVSSTSWWEPATLRGSVGLGDGLTFYAAHGDFIGRAGIFITLLLLILLFVRLFIPKR